VLTTGPVTGKLLLPGEAAERLRVSEKTVRRLVAAGHLTEVRVSERSPRITEASVEAHIASHSGPASQGSAA
jgi:excisionase family DNA binding protein